MTCSLPWWSRFASFLRMRYGPAVWSWVCRTAWYTVSPSRALVWECDAWGPYPGPAGSGSGVGRHPAGGVPESRLGQKVWQYFTVVPDFKSVGVRDGARSFEYPVIFRAINTIDAMEATVEPLDWAVLQAITNRILAEVPGVNRVCYDLSPKPPATIEWE